MKLRHFTLACVALLVPVIACEQENPDPNAPQNPTPNPQYPTASASGTAARPVASPVASTTAAPPTATATTTAKPVATAPVATATATAVQPVQPVQPTPTATAALPTFPTLPALPAFPTFQLPNLAQLSPALLSQALPSLPLDPNLLNQIKQAGQQLMTQGMLVMGDPGETGLKAAASRHAPGMTPEGAAYKDTIPAGGHKAFDVTLAGNKCYTIIAFSPPNNVTNVDLHLLVPPFYNMDAGHDDSTDGTAVIGKAPTTICPFTLIPIPYRVDVSARAGQGQVVVQVYSKNK